MQIRRAVRAVLVPQLGESAGAPLALVALSGGADSLALAAALAAEAPGAGWRAGALIVDHGLQPGSEEVAGRAAEQARALGLDPVDVRRVAVSAGAGPEAAARAARYRAFEAGALAAGATAILTGHTRDDQAEQVLLALARGSGTRSIAGIPAARELAPGCELLRPLLAADPEITRAVTAAACVELGLVPWQDPHNSDHTYARVRVRDTVLPLLREELGPGVQRGLARSADLAAEDAAALDDWAEQVVVDLAELAPRPTELDAADPPEGAEDLPAAYLLGKAGIDMLGALPAAVRQRAIHRVARIEFGVSLSREQTLAIARLVTHWRGQGPAFVSGLRATRSRDALRIERQTGSPRTSASPWAES